MRPHLNQGFYGVERKRRGPEAESSNHPREQQSRHAREPEGRAEVSLRALEGAEPDRNPEAVAQERGGRAPPEPQHPRLRDRPADDVPGAGVAARPAPAARASAAVLDHQVVADQLNGRDHERVDPPGNPGGQHHGGDARGARARSGGDPAQRAVVGGEDDRLVDPRGGQGRGEALVKCTPPLVPPRLGRAVEGPRELHPGDLRRLDPRPHG
eukprot:CAMPEP_0114501026 /NCGR_PEP_ID=MMETSP0109-20121206/8276_1 /TAXON_ID=29199 /ORGANISM="Chlorarachnion reptans, Strain CCCM449" /LENGTH=211 /DNA_ID=CAMNT_0001678723 /DNA_START=396 /DNA_END=1027 /DNA_ORIENTATION=-